ncbi:hypothetical protein NQ315_007892 [Exocentrus adspersus]|uniref:Uncharacterized protein n=1 Tax=Exocentrus adspersus TaxID=1586481 RepID=A0AAV8W960_9CUCU|nr:hypothetical protein NQ315_007892 [Exocentrus adspersus]
MQGILRKHSLPSPYMSKLMCGVCLHTYQHENIFDLCRKRKLVSESGLARLFIGYVICLSSLHTKSKYN